jgi:hypothetical protein
LPDLEETWNQGFPKSLKETMVRKSVFPL